jgi:hypothetical protein
VAGAAAPGMNRWSRVNLLLGGTAALLLALYLWPTAPPPRDLLTTLDAQAVTSIRVERDDRLQLALQLTAQGWHLTQPVEAPAEARRIAQLLAIVHAPVQARFDATGDLAQYGLDRPRAVIRFDQTRLLFGDRDPTQRSRYVLTDDGLQVIDDAYFNLLTLPARHFTGD